MRMLILVVLAAFLSSCNDNPLDSGGYFLAKPGPILFISNKSGAHQLYSMNEDGTNVQQLTNDPDFPIFNASWSPDGSKIAIQSSVGGVPLFGDAIYICNSNGTNRYLLTKSSIGGSNYGYQIYYGASGSCWSPDSKKIAFSRTSRAEPIPGSDIFIIDVDGKNERRLTATPKIFKYATDWSRDGSFIASHLEDFYHPDSLIHLPRISKVLYNLEGVETKFWLGGGELIYSTIGDKIAYDSIGVIFIVEANGPTIRSVPYNTNLYLGIRCWSPDDRKVLCQAATGDEPNKAFLLDIQTGSLTDITPFKDYNGWQFVSSWLRR